ncbi:MAG: magnesium/cobalt transporter CorA [Candidatus Aminicenantes bacterium]|nr:magnesium/cobalt transporter CorA [Candidatus Aminicenantes bacterium]
MRKPEESRTRLSSVRKRSKKAGLPPGSLVHVGERKTERVRITVLDYNEAGVEEREARTVEECFPFKDKPTVTWINVDGIHDTSVIEKLGAHYGIHSLILEDILNTNQRPKMEDMGSYIYIVLKTLEGGPDRSNEYMEQNSFIIGNNFVLSLQEKEGDAFGAVRDRIRRGGNRIRRMGPDYLVYSLIDAIVDKYFSVLERVGERIETLEGELVADPGPETLHGIHTLKNEMLFLRKAVWPLRELISAMERTESELVKKETRLFFRDIYDHVIQVIDTVETYREMLGGMFDTYLSSVSNRMNEVMKVLTIIATIFIPLTFLAGIYGMNFQRMPELGWRWGYPAVWAVMLAVAAVMLVFFKKKKWL